jgi:D-alanyl-D-alanine endopeptidase (penicillin-binding protein 7)
MARSTREEASVIAPSRPFLIALLCCAALASSPANAAHHHKHHRPTAKEVDLIARAIAGATDRQPLLASSEVLVLDEESNDVLLAKNASQVSPMASITKLMTALVVLEADQPMDQMLEITEADEHLDKPAFSRLNRGTLLTRAEMLHLALMASENRAAHALARNFPGGLAACIEAMNAKAESLGMISTRYVEPTGLSPRNVTTPEDLSKLVVVASANETLQAYSTDQKFAVPLGRRLVEFHTTDRLVEHADWHIVLQKTGYIAEAGKCLVMKAIIESRSIVIVLMNSSGAQTRLVDAQRIKSWLDAKASKLASTT